MPYGELPKNYHDRLILAITAQWLVALWSHILWSDTPRTIVIWSDALWWTPKKLSSIMSLVRWPLSEFSPGSDAFCLFIRPMGPLVNSASLVRAIQARAGKKARARRAGSQQLGLARTGSMLRTSPSRACFCGSWKERVGSAWLASWLVARCNNILLHKIIISI
jgi:hypothetical protein